MVISPGVFFYAGAPLHSFYATFCDTDLEIMPFAPGISGFVAWIFVRALTIMTDMRFH